MHKKLRPEDKHAVDLVFDVCAAIGADGKASIVHGDPAAAPSAQRLRRLIQLLDLHTASEPPANLVAKTLAHIESKHKGAPWQAPATGDFRHGKPA
jgi:hypothetical protein